MTRLFSYTIPVDDGAAPNPFYGMCSLAICKPSIRRVAQVGDWVVGLGSKNSPSGDLSGRLVYAMRVEEVVTMKEYDLLAPTRWPHRIPNTNSLALQERLGDCIYDYSSNVPQQRRSVHDEGNIDTDIGGKNVLISKDFYYFGGKAISLPIHLLAICHQTQNHKSTANDVYIADFVSWLRSIKPNVGQLYGWPDYLIDWTDNTSCGSCRIRQIDDVHSSEC
jgi:hypothetical protein